MPLATEGSVVGSITTPGDIERGSVTAWLTTPPPLPSVTGALTAVTVTSYDASVVAYSCRVILDGEDVTADLVEGQVSILRELDKADACEFTLQGSKYVFITSRKLWTKTSLQVFFTQGTNNNSTEKLVFSGFVWTGTQVDVNVFSGKAYVAGNTAFNNKVCFELDPGVNRTRGSILSELAIASGFTSVNIPEGSIYTKPLQIEQSFRNFATLFGEPEGWRFRVVSDTIETYVIRRDKPQPDHKWNANLSVNMSGPNEVPPENVSSTWIFRGHISSVESGSEEETVEPFSNIVKGFFNPQTVARQGSDGVITPRNFAPGAPFGSFLENRVTKQLDTTIVRIGSRIVRKEEIEQTWINPLSAKFETASAGPGPQNANFVESFIDQNGNNVVSSAAKFLVTLKRVEFFTHDSEGTLISSRIQSEEYHTKTAAVKDNVSQQDIIGVLVGEDLRSYQRNGPKLHQISGFGLAAEYFLTYTYDDDSKVRVSEVQSSFAHYSARTHSGTGWRLFDGTSTLEKNAFFQEVEIHSKDNIVDNSSLKVGEVSSAQEFFANEGTEGVSAFDYGGGKFSDFASELFVTTSVEADSFEAFTPNEFFKVEFRNLRRRSQSFPGRPPAAIHKGSVWTQYVDVAVESFLQDDTTEDFFGRGFEIVNLEYPQTQAEMDNVLIRRRARQLSFIIDFERHETVAAIGDDVLVTDIEQRFSIRCIIVAEHIKRSRSISTVEYTMEATRVIGVPIL